MSEQLTSRDFPRETSTLGQSQPQARARLKAGTSEDRDWVFIDEVVGAGEDPSPSDDEHTGDTTEATEAIVFDLISDESQAKDSDHALLCTGRRCRRIGHLCRNCLGTARVQTTYERNRYDQCCQLVQNTLARIDEVSQRPDFVEEALGLRQQLLNDIKLVSEQRLVLEQTEAKVARLEGALARKKELGRSGKVRRCGDRNTNCGSCWNPPLLESWIRRAGDASIARERIAELDYEALLLLTGGAATGEESLSDADLSPVERERRRGLEGELCHAIHDAEILRAQCIAQGLDVEQAEYC